MAKIKQKVVVDSEFNAIRVVAKMRHQIDDAPNGMFGLTGETLDIIIDLEPEARIRGWSGPAIKLHAKVCDCCSVYFLDFQTQVAAVEGDYVPSFMPGKHWGDYLIFDIAENGVITNWKKNADYQGYFDSMECD